MDRLRGRDGERAVSEVLSVLLMVTVAIVLAAMVGSVLLGIVSDVDDNALAGVQIDFDEGTDEISVVYTVTQKEGTTVDVKVLDAGGDEVCEKSIPKVGAEAAFTSTGPCGLEDGNEYTVRVVANASSGKQSVVREETGTF